MCAESTRRVNVLSWVGMLYLNHDIFRDLTADLRKLDIYHIELSDRVKKKVKTSIISCQI